MLVVLFTHNLIIFKLVVILLIKLIRQLILQQLAIFIQLMQNKLQFMPFIREFILQLKHLLMQEFKQQNLQYLLLQFKLLLQ
jgi:hypothetical protein